MAEDLIDLVSRVEGLHLALLVLAVVFAESLVITDFVAPGEVGLVVAGAAAAANGTSLPLVVGAAAVGAVLGDALGYTLGRSVGTDLIEHRRWLRWLRPSLRRARRRFDRHGPVIVAAARWVGALRAVVPVVAGSAQLSAPRFVVAAVPSAIAWTATMASVGFLWGDDIAGAVDRVGIGVSVAVVAIIVVIVVIRRRRSGSHDAADDGARITRRRPRLLGRPSLRRDELP